MSVLFQHRRGLCAQYGRDEGRLQMEAPGSGKMHPAFRRRGDGKTILHSLQVDVCWLLRLLDEFAPGEQQQDGLRICIHFESLNLFYSNARKWICPAGDGAVEAEGREQVDHPWPRTQNHLI